MFNNMKIGIRLFIGFSIMVLLLIVVSGFSISRMMILASDTEDLYAHPFVVNSAVQEFHTSIAKMQKNLKEIVLANTYSEPMDRFIEDLNKQEKEAYRFLNIIKKNINTNQENIYELERLLKEWKPLLNESIALAKANETQKIKAIRTKNNEQVKEIEKQISVVENASSNMASSFMKDAKDTAKKAYTLTIILIIIGVVIAVFISSFLIKSINKPLENLIKIAEQIAERNLSTDLSEENRQDEIGILLMAFRKMIHNLRGEIGDIKEAVNVLSSSAGEISVSMAEFATSATQTFTAINETTTTAEEMKQTSQDSSKRASDVSNLAQQAMEISQTSGLTVAETIKGMDTIRLQMESIAESIIRLSEQSQTIGRITSTVEDLAEQSNLLAVNASIEAAKAGEQGKGFSVVAQEIRMLANQSKQATGQVREILEDIQKAINTAVMATEQGSKTVEAGVKKSYQAGESIQSSIDNINEVMTAITQIAATAEQQYIAMDQVVTAAINIQEASSQNLENIRQLENATNNLNGLSQNLREFINKYKLDKKS